MVKAVGLLALAALSSVASLGAAAEVVAYPSVDGLPTSGEFRVSVAGRPVWVEALDVHVAAPKAPLWYVGPLTEHQELHLASFACDGPVEAVIETPAPVAGGSVHPLSRGITPRVAGTAVKLALPGPGKYYVKLDGLPELCLFANRRGSAAPAPETPGVVYYGPGVHRIGEVTLSSGDRVYLAAGAVVYGAFRMNDAHDVSITGPGTLDGAFTHNALLRITGCSDVTIRGPVLRNCRSWTNRIIDCERVTFDDVKVVRFYNNGDGISVLGSRDVVIRDCFLRCTDDCIAIKSPEPDHVVENVTVEGCTMVGYAFSDGLTIGFETRGPTISDVVMRDCDVVLAEGGNAVGGHSAFSIICDGPARISDIRFEDIRVEENVPKLFELHVTDGKYYGDDTPGSIDKVYLKNVRWRSEKAIHLYGHDREHGVSNVVFDNCRRAGQLLTDLNPEFISANAFVSGVRFVHD